MSRIFRSWVLYVAVVGLASAGPATHPLPVHAASTVVRLYQDYAWEAVIDEPQDTGQALFSQSADVLGRYFAPDLVALILRDRACEERSHEICRLDFDPIWASQDPGATEMAIRQSGDPARVTVDFTYPGNGEHIHIVYVLVRMRDGWRIADIQDPGTSLRKILQADLPP
jgi:hypothetical protein